MVQNVDLVIASVKNLSVIVKAQGTWNIFMKQQKQKQFIKVYGTRAAHSKIAAS